MSIWEKIAETSWWIYPLVVYFIFLSFAATKPRAVSLKNIIIMPVIFIPLSIPYLFVSFPITGFNVLVWLTAMVIGTALGWLQFKIFKVKAIKDESAIYFPGTFSMLFFIPLLLLGYYFYGSTLHLNAGMLSNPSNAVFFLGGYGVLAGLFIGRVIYCRNCVKKGPFRPFVIPVKA